MQIAPAALVAPSSTPTVPSTPSVLVPDSTTPKVARPEWAERASHLLEHATGSARVASAIAGKVDPYALAKSINDAERVMRVLRIAPADSRSSAKSAMALVTDASEYLIRAREISGTSSDVAGREEMIGYFAGRAVESFDAAFKLLNR